MKTSDVEIKVYAEGVRIPVVGLSRNQVANGQFQFSVTIAPTRDSFRVLPNTLIHAFIIQHDTDGDPKSKLFAEGYVSGRSYSIDIHGRKNMVLQCLGYDSAWARMRLGLQIGDGSSVHRGLLHQMFVGLSAGSTGQIDDILPNQAVSRAAMTLAIQNQTNVNQDTYLSLQYFLTEFMAKHGPMSGLVYTIMNLAGASPLFRQLYNAARIPERIVYKENFRIAQLAREDAILKSMFGHLENMSSDATLMDLMQLILTQTEHQYVFIPSPMFNRDDLSSEDEYGKEWEAVIYPPQIRAQDGYGGYGGNWTWPVPGHTTIRSGVGRRRQVKLSNGNLSSGYHSGVDLAIPTGTRVLSAKNGTVETILRNARSGYGLAVYVRHPDGYQTRYAHLSHIAVSEDQSIQAGALIGLSGNTGNSTGPHLHFEIRDSSNRALDPEAIILRGQTINNVPPPATARPATVPGTRMPARRTSGAPFLENPLDGASVTNFTDTDPTHAIPRMNGAGSSSSGASSSGPNFTPTNVTVESSCVDLLKDPRIRAFLDLIFAVEIDGSLFDDPTRTPAHKSNDVYRTMFGGALFPSLEDHPRNAARKIAPDGRTTTAAGKYQFQPGTWDEQRRHLAAEGTPIERFTEQNQELAAVSIIKYKRPGILRMLLEGRIAELLVYDQLHSEWQGFTNNRWSNQQKLNLYRTRLGQEVTSGDFLSSDASSSWRDMSQEERDRALQRYVDFGEEDFEKFESKSGALRQMTFMPRLRYAPPPVCNIFFPDKVSNLDMSEDFNHAPTRLMMMADPTGAYSFVSGFGDLAANATSAHFSPRYIQGIFDTLRGNNANSDILGKTQLQQAEAIMQDYLDELEELRAQGIDPEEHITDPHMMDVIYEQMAASRTGVSKEDLARRILGGQEDLPQSLLGMYTYDELFRGIIPMIGRFPYGTGNLSAPRPPAPEGTEEEVQEEVVTPRVGDWQKLRRRASNENIGKGVTRSGEVIRTLSEEKAEEQSREIITRVSAEEEVVNLFSNYQFSMMQNEPRRANLTIPFSMDVACGFQGAIYDTSIGWVTGEVVAVTDIVDTQSKGSITQITMIGCRFMGDYDDATWARIHAEGDAEAHHLYDDGVPESPLLFDDEFSAERIGDTVYKPILGIPSVLDWALTNRGSKEINGLREALEVIEDHYEKSGAGGLSRSEWVNNFTSRPVAEESNIMEEMLEGKSDSYGYSGTYPAWKVPDIKGTPFMQERRAWAKSYINTIQKRASTISINTKEQ